eukprot:TRINITY_DN3082_c0_g1_i19.p1 TRINITY_DN3082_c0_g1~~TRINITY_DN3082_c0_g1_i19.p1  ORF type:complete len:215 (+),score=21.80 TRINITY_DN3082_c0_g1_i19:249-893(+)
MEFLDFDGICKEIFDTLSKGKKNRRVRVCILESNFTVLKTAKVFYNHCHTSKCCGGIHETLKLATLDEGIGRLLGGIKPGSTKLRWRKPRNDAGKSHAHPAKTAFLSSNAHPHNETDSRFEEAKCPGSSTDYPGFIIPENLVANDIPCMFRDSFEEEKMGFELDAETGPTIPDGMADSSADADWFFPPPLNAAECFEGSEDTTFSEESQGGDDF